MSKSLKDKTLIYLKTLKLLSDYYNNFSLDDYKKKCLDLDIISKLNNFPAIQEPIYKKIYGEWDKEYRKHNYMPNVYYSLDSDNNVVMDIRAIQTYNSSNFTDYVPTCFHRTFMGKKERDYLNEIANSVLQEKIEDYYNSFRNRVKSFIKSIFDKIKGIAYNDYNIVLLFKDLTPINVGIYIDRIINCIEKLNTPLGAYDSFKDVCSLYNASSSEDREKLLKDIIMIEDYFDRKLFSFSNNSRLLLRDLRGIKDGDGDISIINVGINKPYYIIISNYDVRVCSNYNSINYNDFNDYDDNIFEAIKEDIEKRWKKSHNIISSRY